MQEQTCAAAEEQNSSYAAVALPSGFVQHAYDYHQHKSEQLSTRETLAYATLQTAVPLTADAYPCSTPMVCIPESDSPDKAMLLSRPQLDVLGNITQAHLPSNMTDSSCADAAAQTFTTVAVFQDPLQQGCPTVTAKRQLSSADGHTAGADFAVSSGQGTGPTALVQLSPFTDADVMPSSDDIAAGSILQHLSTRDKSVPFDIHDAPSSQWGTSQHELT